MIKEKITGQQAYEWACGGVPKHLALWYRTGGFTPIVPLSTPKEELALSFNKTYFHLGQNILRPLLPIRRPVRQARQASRSVGGFYELHEPKGFIPKEYYAMNQGLQRQTENFPIGFTREEEIEEWWEREPLCNIGFYAGEISNTLTITSELSTSITRKWVPWEKTVTLRFNKAYVFFFKYPYSLFNNKNPEQIAKATYAIANKFNFRIGGITIGNYNILLYLPPILNDEGRHTQRNLIKWEIPPWEMEKQPLSGEVLEEFKIQLNKQNQGVL